MNILEILDLEEPVEDFGVPEDETKVSAVKGAFRNVLHGFKKATKKNTSKAVTSSWIAGLDYDHSNGVCTMRLNDGRNYDIRGMKSNIFYSWLKSPSKGKFFHRYVKGNYI